MAETIEVGCSGAAKWHWFNVMHDLEVQGELPGVFIDPLSVEAHGCMGVTTKGTKFCLTWMAGKFLLLSVSQPEPELVEAFAKVVEYRPFCKYIGEHGLLTFEWDKVDPVGRFAELSKWGPKELQSIQ